LEVYLEGLSETGELHLDPLLPHVLVEDCELVAVLLHLEVDPCDQVSLLVPRQKTPEIVDQVSALRHVDCRRVGVCDVDEAREGLLDAVPRGPLVPLDELVVHRRELVVVLFANVVLFRLDEPTCTGESEEEE
jgi:hypothetical protein